MVVCFITVEVRESLGGSPSLEIVGPVGVGKPTWR